MWTSLAFVAALSLLPGQSEQLTLTNVRTTHGILGVPRSDDKFLPGDNLLISFDIEGIKTNANGKVRYSIALEVTDSDGKVRFRKAPRDQEANNSLGGDSLPAYANIQIGLDQQPGKYKVKVTVTDLEAKGSRAITRPFEVLPRALGVVRLTTTTDADGQIYTSFFGTGQSLWVNFVVVGFGRDEAKGQPDLTVTLTILDEKKQPTTSRPFTGAVKEEIPKKVLALPLQFVVQLNRAGKFTVVLKATDNVTGKTATLSFPLTVLRSK